MPYELFLPEITDQARRQYLWATFQAGQNLAWTFASSPAQWVPLRRIDALALGEKAGHWNPTGKIQVFVNVEPGLLFHETFHTVAHRSPLHAGNDGHWIEAFCDAFRYVAEHEILAQPPSTWVAKVDGFMAMNAEQARAAPGALQWKTVYTYPASIILRRSGGTLAGLRQLWFQLAAMRQQAGTDILDQFFGYSPNAALRDWAKKEPEPERAPLME